MEEKEKALLTEYRLQALAFICDALVQMEAGVKETGEKFLSDILQNAVQALRVAMLHLKEDLPPEVEGRG